MQSVLFLLNYKTLTTDILDSVLSIYISQTEELNTKILNLNKTNLSWSTLVQPSININNTYIISAFLQMKQFHPNEKIREHANNISTKLEQYSIENSMRKDIYTIVKYYYDNQYKLEQVKLSNEQRSYFEDIIKNYKHSGLDLPDDKYIRLKDIKKEISQLSSQYELNLDNYSKTFEFTKDQLDGLPDKFIKDRISNNIIKVTLEYPDYIPVMEYCKNRDIRKQLNYEFSRKAYDTNVELAEKIFTLRKEIASIFSVENYSDYKLFDSMADSTKTVMNFLDKIYTKVKPLLKKDIDTLLSLAQQDNITKIELYDIAYYSRIYTEKTIKINKEELKEYFPIEKTISNILMIYQQLLGYVFDDVTDEYKYTLWDDKVKLYMVKDQYTNLIKGYFYLDLYPREGKYGHAAVFPFISKSKDTLPVASMACNFDSTHMSFNELETFFHEFGHVMHHISSVSTISGTASFGCEQDFVETPSQMFEEWCYTNKTLKLMSDKIPDDIIEKIKQQRNVLQGYYYAKQLSQCYLDMNIHSKNYNHNSFETYKKITKDILGLDIQDNTSLISSFSHLISGYDAGYYGYLWSLVYAKDLFTKFIDRELDQSIGMLFRDTVLSQGSIRPSLESVNIFLGRKPNEDAFISSII
jgi:Zn-dependent oligopeptidase